MKSFLNGAIFGGAVVAAASIGYAFGAGEAPTGEELEAAVEAGRCNVRVGYGQMQVGEQCRFNQVMVGTRSDYLLCSDIEVTCD